MKKFTALSLIAILCLSLSACSGSSSSREETTKATEAAVEKETTEEGTVEENEEALENEYLKIGEAGVSENGVYEFTLEHFEFVDSVFDYPYCNVSKSVESYSETIPEKDNTLIAVTYKVKDVGKAAAKLQVRFGSVVYDDGYVYSSTSPMGIHLVCAEGSTNIIGVDLTLQPLSEAVEVSAFLEVPKVLESDTDSMLLYRPWEGVTYEIRSGK